MKKRIIEEICREKSIEKIDISYDWISILKKDGIEKKIINYNFDLNSAVSVKLANDKYSTYEILTYYGIPVVEYDILFNDKKLSNVDYINKNFDILRNDDKVVIKVNESSQGKDIYLCDNQDRKFEVVNKLFEEGNNSVCVCPYLDIEYEYRALYLDGEIIYIYKKEKPFVIGDGENKLRDLINKNLKYFNEPLENLNLDYIPKNNEKVIVGWKHNLSKGAVPIIINENDKYYDRIKEIALKTGKAMDLTYAAIDVIVTKNNEICVMEVNANNVVVTKFCEIVPNGYEIQKEIFGKVIDKMFEEGTNENTK